MNQEELDAFWGDARIRGGLNQAGVMMGPNVDETLPPPAWSFGPDPQTADRLLEAVLAGRKRVIVSPRFDYAAHDTDLPDIGDLSILLDGGDHPRALIRTTAVECTTVAQVSAADAGLDAGEPVDPDTWQEATLSDFAARSPSGGQVDGDTPIVLERFDVLVIHDLPQGGEPGRQRHA